MPEKYIHDVVTVEKAEDLLDNTLSSVDVSMSTAILYTGAGVMYCKFPSSEVAADWLAHGLAERGWLRHFLTDEEALGLILGIGKGQRFPDYGWDAAGNRMYVRYATLLRLSAAGILIRIYDSFHAAV